jgi:hypothetical protein
MESGDTSEGGVGAAHPVGARAGQVTWGWLPRRDMP